MIETKVYVGLNDGDTKVQEHETSYYVSLLKQVCVDYGVPFSFYLVQGGYIHESGEYTEENTIVLSFVDLRPDISNAIAKDLCSLFNQETVLVTTGPVKVYSVHEG